MAGPHGAQRQIRLFRSVLGVPQYNQPAADSTKTVAVTYGKNGRAYFAVPRGWSRNWASRRSQFARDYQITDWQVWKSLEHAEATSLLLYLEDIVSLEGENAVIFVDRKPCKDFCHEPLSKTKGGLGLLRQQILLDVLVVSDLEGPFILLTD